LAETPLQIFVPTKGAAKAVTERCTLPWHTIKTSTSAKESRWEFFCQPGHFGCPITAESWAAIFIRWAQPLRRSGRAAAARSTGLRPTHFIHFIETANNADLTYLKEYAIITTS